MCMGEALIDSVIKLRFVSCVRFTMLLKWGDTRTIHTGFHGPLKWGNMMTNVMFGWELSVFQTKLSWLVSFWCMLGFGVEV